MAVLPVFEVKPYIGVGALCFGHTLAQVRKLLEAYEHDEESRTEFEDSLVIKQYYEAFDLIVGADGNGVVEYFEFFHSPQLEPTVTLNGVALLPQRYQALREQLRSRDPDVEDDGMSIRSLRLGLVIGEPRDESDERPESVLVFRRGYWDA